MEVRSARPAPAVDDEPPAPATRAGWLAWLGGWVVGPSLVALVIVALGVHVGARYPDAAWIRVIRSILG